MDSLELVKIAAKALDSKLGNDITVLKVDTETVIASYFVICHGNSNTQVNALASEVEYQLSLQGITPYGSEGYSSANWILLDYGDVIVHIFDEESRNFFKLEKLWSSAERISFKESK